MANSGPGADWLLLGTLPKTREAHTTTDGQAARADLSAGELSLEVQQQLPQQQSIFTGRFQARRICSRISAQADCLRSGPSLWLAEESRLLGLGATGLVVLALCSSGWRCFHLLDSLPCSHNKPLVALSRGQEPGL